MAKAKEALAAEVNDDSVEFEFRDVKYTIQVGDGMPLPAARALEMGKIIAFTDAMLGDAQMAKAAKSGVSTVADLRELANHVLVAMGSNQGE